MKWPTGALESVAILGWPSVDPIRTQRPRQRLHTYSDSNISTVITGLQSTAFRPLAPSGLKSNKFQFSDRHVLFGKLRPYLRKIARPKFSGVCSTDIIPILPKDGVSRDYLFYFLRTPDTVNLATSRCSGVNLPRLSPKQLASRSKSPSRCSPSRSGLRGFWMRRTPCGPSAASPSPSSTNLLQSTFLDMFGDPVTNPKGWTMVEPPMCRRCDSYGYGTHTVEEPQELLWWKGFHG